VNIEHQTDCDNPFLSDNKWNSISPNDCHKHTRCWTSKHLGSYAISKDSDGKKILTITGSLSWSTGPRVTSKPLSVFFALKTPDSSTEWGSFTWDPFRRSWTFYSSENKCRLFKV